MRKTISEMLREIKAETGISDAEIGRRVGVSQPVINRLLHGKRDCLYATGCAIEHLYAVLVFKAPVSV